MDIFSRPALHVLYVEFSRFLIIMFCYMISDIYVF